MSPSDPLFPAGSASRPAPSRSAGAWASAAVEPAPGRRAALASLLFTLVGLFVLPGLRASAIPEIESSISDQSGRFKLGALEVFGYGSAGLGLDNNVFLTHSNRKAALFAFLVPGLRAKRDDDNNHLTIQFDYQGRARRYAGEGNVARASYMEHQFVLQTIWKQTPALTWDFNNSAAYLVEPVNASIPRAERFQNVLGAIASYTARTTDFKFNGSFDVQRMSRNLFRFLDYDALNFGARAVYRNIGPKAYLLGDYLLVYYNMRDRSRSDVLVNYLLVGAATPLGENKGWVYELKIGGALMQVVANRAATPGADQLTSLVLIASAKWSQNDPDTYLRFTFKNEIEPSNSAGVTFSNIYSLQADGQYVFNRSFRAGGRVAQQWIEEISSPNDSAMLLLAGSVTYHRVENLSFFGRAEFRMRFAHLRADRYDDLRLIGGATYVF